MAKPLVLLVVMLVFAGISTESFARSGGNGSSKSTQQPPNTTKATAATASGKRQHKPISVTKEWGGSSPNQGSNQQVQPLLRGNNSDNGKGGRY